MNSRMTIRLMLMATALACITSCRRQIVYFHYEHTPQSGWEKNDTLNYSVSPLTDDCTLHEEVALRINSFYPFQKLCLVLEQEILPAGIVRNDTLNCRLFDNEGYVQSKGMGYFQFSFHLTDMQLARGDSLHIMLRHNMKREILPGIIDVGIQLKRKQ